jgi:hypothetical protein
MYKPLFVYKWQREQETRANSNQRHKEKGNPHERSSYNKVSRSKRTAKGKYVPPGRKTHCAFKPHKILDNQLLFEQQTTLLKIGQVVFMFFNRALSFLM